MKRVARAPLAATAALAAGGIAFFACAKKPSVTFELQLPNGLAQDTAWFEIGVYPNGTCPTGTSLAGGIAADGTVERFAFASDTKSPPALGDLAKGRYGFAAVARRVDCTVIAAGCSVVDVNDARDVSIALAPTPGTAGTCANGTVCQNALCVPGIDNNNPSVGAGCSLQLLGAGPLGDPLSPGTLLSAPVVVATDTGFLVAYREFDPVVGAARLTLVPVDNGGGSQALSTTTLCSCTGSPETDATAMAWSGTKGLVALARQPCTTCDCDAGCGGGVDLFAVDATGAVVQSGFSAVAGAKPTLMNGHALAATPSGFLLAFTNGGAAYVTPVNGVLLSPDPLQTKAFGGAPPQTGALVAASASGVGLLAFATGAIGPSPGDGGAEGGTSDASSGSGPVLRVSSAPLGADLGALGPPFELPGSWGALSMVGSRILVVSNGDVPGKPVAWTAFDVGNPARVLADGFSSQLAGKVVSADVALHQDHAFFAVELPAALTLFAFGHVSTKPAYIREEPLSSLSRVSIGDVRDGLVSVAASDTRVAVAWGTAKVLGRNDSVGGYAVFACTP